MISARVKRTLFLSLAIGAALVALILGAYLVSAKVYDNKIYPGVMVDSLNLGGLPLAEATKIVKDQSDNLASQELPFIYKNRIVRIASTKSSYDIDLSAFMWDFDSEATVKNAYQVGRAENFWVNIWSQMKLRFNSKKINFVYRLNEDGVKEELKSKFGDLEIPVKNAELEMASSSFIFNVKEAANGETIDYDRAINELKNNLVGGEIKPITLTSKIDLPAILRGDVGNFQVEADNLLTLAPLILEYRASSSDKLIFKFEVNKAKLATLLGLARNGGVKVVLFSELVQKFLEAEIVPKVDKAPTKA